MYCIRFLFILASTFFFIHLSSAFAIDARVETTEGEVFTIKDFSMEGRRSFSLEYKGAATSLDWRDIVSFEIKKIGPTSWVEVELTDGKKEVFRIRQMFPFRGKSEFGKWSVPYEKVKKVFLFDTDAQELRDEKALVKESSIPFSPTSKEVDRITMRNGDTLLGDILNESISIRTPYGTISFKKENILRVILGVASGRGQRERELDVLYSKYGDKLTGMIANFEIRVNLLSESNLSLGREHIKEIEFKVLPEIEQRIPREKPFEPPSKSPVTR